MGPFELRIFAQAQVRPLTVIGHDVFTVAPQSPRSGVFRRIASLVSEARMLSDRLHADERLPAFLRASSYLELIPILRFCLRELLPCLQDLADDDASPRPNPSEVERLLERLDDQASILKISLARKEKCSISPDDLAQLLSVPCEITATHVIPLNPSTQLIKAAQLQPGGLTTLRRRYENKQAHVAVERSIEQLFRSRSRALANEQNLEKLSTEFLATVRKVVDLHRPGRRANFSVLYLDRFHELQFSQGHFMLVRGPVRSWIREGVVFVGIPIAGHTRSQLLSVPPGAAAHSGAFWTADGKPNPKFMCMGHNSQYMLRKSAIFSDAEALIQWLDAGVVLATGRPAFHKIRRRRSLPAADRSSTLIRRR